MRSTDNYQEAMRLPEEASALPSLEYKNKDINVPDFLDKGIIVVTGIYDDKEKSQKDLNRPSEYYKHACIKKMDMWMGCIH